MSGREARSARVVLTPVHVVRAGAGLDAVRVQVRGFGLVIGSFGVRRVGGSLDAVVLHRFPAGRCRALFVGLGLGWASTRLAPAAAVSVPAVAALAVPAPPPAPPAPAARVQLTVTPPVPP